ncbi:DUF6064 family protein [Rhizobacter sp. Root404]|jgi:hypothetical protein|uniref:DUF6064 family protein n=1 Tax=Rhizobacter sp. Root404 TaxID=1736528 RepID=UPI0006FB39AF|nr:DUF6064 family protein [Rhizobacter sp. Root404]KQW39930.1 hypothetical protein ASC76_00230 [Rhizobacter sp. Root404]
MHIPLTIDQFFGVIRQYNIAVWPTQVLLLAIALLAVYLAVRPHRHSGVVISAILGFLWLWTGLAYHLAFFAAVNPLAYAFAAASVVGASVFIRQGVIQRRLRFHATVGAWPMLGMGLIVLALAVYPAWSIVAGHRYPELPTFGLPCPTALFTVGMLSLLTAPYPRAPLAVPVAWCFVGAQAALFFDVPPDLTLLAAAAVGIALILRARPLHWTKAPLK